ncbi:hypothetical protein JCM17823_10170 [Halorubrum gandharaense]
MPSRRAVLCGIAGLGSLAGLAGCLDRGPITSFELTSPTIEPEEPPRISTDDNTVVVEGTAWYGSSSCSTLELAHARYHERTGRLDVLVAPADDRTLPVPLGCTDDLASTGYVARIVAGERLRIVTATEHHVHGDAYSTTAGSPRDPL